MRFSTTPLVVLLVALFALLPTIHAWTKEDHEIFRLRDELITLEGEDVSFYKYIGVSPSASGEDVTKQLRKKSRQLHPDKAIPSLLAQRSKEKSQAARDKSKGRGKKPGVQVTKGPSSREQAAATREANERYAHFQSIAGVLRGPERDRYDHFLRNGFPAWKGTGYYYQRFRPGLGTVLIGLGLVVGGGVHYGALYLGWKRHRDFVERYVRHARKMAWGNESGIPGIDSVPGSDPMAAAQHHAIHQPIEQPPQEEEEAPQPMNRKQKRAMEKDAKKKEKANASVKSRVGANGKNGVPVSAPIEAARLEGPQGNKKRVVAENGKVLIVDSIGNVFLEEETEEGDKNEYLLDPDEIPAPTIFQTALFRVPVWMYRQTVGRAFSQPDSLDEPLLEGQEVLVQRPEDHSQELMTSATAANPKAEARKRKGKTQERVDAAVDARNGL